eukprot:Clim_evm2s88 gene=Clim_evmTU2s88
MSGKLELRNLSRRLEAGLPVDSQTYAQSKDVPKIYKRDLGIYQKFPTQREAVEAQQKDLNQLKIFSEESSKGEGKRCFIVTSYDKFWEVYSGLSPDRRCHYELIQEGQPCKLYLDLEYSLELNPALQNGMSIALDLCKFILDELQTLYEIEDTLEDCLILLDSSSATKFSAHAVFNLRNHCFADNAQVGAFMQYIGYQVSKATESKPSHPFRRFIVRAPGHSDELQATQFSDVDVVTPGLQDVPIFDPSVYSRNRNFRLYLSTKRNKERWLKLAPECSYQRLPDAKDRSLREPRERLLFLHSLVCKLDPSQEKNVIKCGALLASGASFHRWGNASTWYDTVRTEGYNTSCVPYPSLHAFIQNLITHDTNSPGKVRKWSWLQRELPGATSSEGRPWERIIFEIEGYRYCYNIRRHHRSNNIYYVADLRNRVLLQRCHDADCRNSGFIGHPLEIPTKVVEECAATFTNGNSPVQTVPVAHARGPM